MGNWDETSNGLNGSKRQFARENSIRKKKEEKEKEKALRQRCPSKYGRRIIRPAHLSTADTLGSDNSGGLVATACQTCKG
jgi:hypothetical protein